MQSVKVLYKFVDGAHFFVSDDEETLGLCVAHKNPQKAFEAVSKQLKILAKENLGEEIEFVPALELSAFLRWLEGRNMEAMNQPTPGAAGMVPWARKRSLEVA